MPEPGRVPGRRAPGVGGGPRATEPQDGVGRRARQSRLRARRRPAASSPGRGGHRPAVRRHPVRNGRHRPRLDPRRPCARRSWGRAAPGAGRSAIDPRLGRTHREAEGRHPVAFGSPWPPGRAGGIRSIGPLPSPASPTSAPAGPRRFSRPDRTGGSLPVASAASSSRWPSVIRAGSAPLPAGAVILPLLIRPIRKTWPPARVARFATLPPGRAPVPSTGADTDPRTVPSPVRI